MSSNPSARGGLNRRVLLACSDTPARERIAAALNAAEIEVTVADDSQLALALFARQSFSVLIADQKIGSSEGLSLVQLVRALSIESVYVIMMTSETSGAKMELGYCAGVDQHMPRDVAASATVDRVQAAFKAIALRRASRGLAFGHDVITVDLASGAHTARHLVGRLSAEIKVAQHTKRPLEIVILRIQSRVVDAAAAPDEGLSMVLEAVQTAVRPKTDWIACLHSVGQNHRLAVVLPDCAGGSAAALEQHVRNAFALNQSSTHSVFELSFGHVTFQATEATELPTALELLAQAEPNRRKPPTVAKKAEPTPSEAEPAAETEPAALVSAA